MKRSDLEEYNATNPGEAPSAGDMVEYRQNISRPGMPIEEGDDFDVLESYTWPSQKKDTHKSVLIELSNGNDYTVGEIIPCSLTVLNSNGTVASGLNKTFYMPLIRQSDGAQIDFVEMEFVGGVCNTNIQCDEPGICKIDIDKIYPPTKAYAENEQWLRIKKA